MCGGIPEPAAAMSRQLLPPFPPLSGFKRRRVEEVKQYNEESPPAEGASLGIGGRIRGGRQFRLRGQAKQQQ